MHRNPCTPLLSIANIPSVATVYTGQIRRYRLRGFPATIRAASTHLQEEMFRLQQLDIHGFKSFYDPAKLTFPAAMTAVVGPNGCGKSNICDALIWVLGENRATHIRGETMEDVIFQGSARRRPLSMGEVTLTLGTLNGDSDHPMSDDGKIVINRRVFRDGQS